MTNLFLAFFKGCVWCTFLGSRLTVFLFQGHCNDALVFQTQPYPLFRWLKKFTRHRLPLSTNLQCALCFFLVIAWEVSSSTSSLSYESLFHATGFVRIISPRMWRTTKPSEINFHACLPNSWRRCRGGCLSTGLRRSRPRLNSLNSHEISMDFAFWQYCLCGHVSHTLGLFFS